MKKFLVFLVACVALVACNNRGNEPQEPIKFEKGQVVTIKAGMPNDVPAQGPSRKITGTDNTQKNQIDYTWETGDKILVKVGEASAEFTLSKGAGTASAEFTGTMPASGSTFSIQYPTTTPDLSIQTYSSTVAIPAGKMLFTKEDCTLQKDLSFTANLKPQYAILQIGFKEQGFGTHYFVNSITIKAGSTTYNLTVPKPGANSDEHTFSIVMNPTGDSSVDLTVEVSYTNSMNISGTKTRETTQKLTAGECLVLPKDKKISEWLDKNEPQ